VVLSIALWGLSAAGACLLSARPAGAVPLPDHDPFYAVPAGIAGLPNGTILKSRSVRTSAGYGLVPTLARSWQVQYKTEDTQFRASADVATIMVPDAPWTGTGPRPLVSYQTAEDGVGSKCSPSYALDGGVVGADGNSETETGLIFSALRRGWAVIAPDYEGPKSDFLGAAGEAHGVLDGVRAALRFHPDGVRPSTPIGLWGYSGGSLASVLAAMAQPTYAPELHFAGIALGGLVTNLKATLDDFNSGPGGGAIVVGMVGLNRSYPKAHLLRYLNAAGRKAVANSQSDCLTDGIIKYPFADYTQYEAYPGAVTGPAFTALLHNASPLWLPGTPTAPIYDYHAVNDEFAPVTADRQLLHRFCNAGVPVDHVETPVGEHLSEAVTGAPGAMDYLASRFANKAVPQNCASILPGNGPLTPPTSG
jgi:Secretory lipase